MKRETDPIVNVHPTATATTACAYHRKCPYCLNSVALPLVSWETLVKAYCQAEVQRCARFLVYSEFGGAPMPTDLRPDQLGRAYEILSCSYYGG